MSPEKFRLLCEMLGLSAQDIAARFNVSQEDVQLWCTAGGAPDSIAFRLENRFKTFVQSTDDMLEANSENPEAVVTFRRYEDDAQCIFDTGLSASEHAAFLRMFAFRLVQSGRSWDIVPGPSSI